MKKHAIDWVDPFIGTGGDHGQLYPGATVPFGLVKLSPDTGHGQSGYDFYDHKILGFSHTRIGGVGCDGAGGTLKIQPALEEKILQAYDKSSERASPGAYQLTFENGIKVECTVDHHAGYHHYEFPAGSPKIHIDPTHNYAGHVRADMQVKDSQTLEGVIEGKNVCSHSSYTLYFAIRFNQSFKTPPVKQTQEALWLAFENPGTIEVRVGLSPVSVEQACAEISRTEDQSFEVVREQAAQKWQDILGKYTLSGDVPEGMQDQATLFYTCLYRAHLIPHNVTSSAGTYRLPGDEETLRQTTDKAPDYTHYAGWSTWDDYRKFALFSLMEPGHSLNIARSISEWIASGNTPDWADGYWPCPSVRNEFMPAILLDAYTKGLREYDLAGSYEAGIPVQGNKQVEQPYGHYVKAKLAQFLGKEEEAKEEFSRALDYRKYWHADQADNDGTVRGFITPDGNAFPPDQVDKIDAGFYEGNLWHYRFTNSYDMGGLSQLRGSRKALADDLEYYFNNWHHMALNEPPLANPFLFVYLGRPDLTQKWSRMYTTETVTSRYHNHGCFKQPVVRPVYQATPDGFLPSMDDDTGAMSAQYVYQSIGLYPVVMGDTTWIIASPIFPEVTLQLPNEKSFVIRADKVSKKNFYIQSATLNDKPYTKAWIDHRDIAAGGVLVLQMGPEPSDWGASLADAPPSLTGYTDA